MENTEHGLAKIFHNKRINQETGRIERMSPADFVRNIRNFYFDLRELIRSLGLEYALFSDIFYTNYINFATDVREIDRFLSFLRLSNSLSLHEHSQQYRLAFAYMICVRT